MSTKIIALFAILHLTSFATTDDIEDKSLDAMIAIMENDSEALRQILSAFPDVKDYRDKTHGITPLHSAVYHQCVACVKHLITAGADPHVVDTSGRNPLKYAFHIDAPSMRGHMIYRILEAMCHWSDELKKRQRQRQ